MPHLRLRANRAVRGRAMVSSASFSNLGAILSGLVALFPFKVDILRFTELAWISMVDKVGMSS